MTDSYLEAIKQCEMEWTPAVYKQRWGVWKKMDQHGYGPKRKHTEHDLPPKLGVILKTNEETHRRILTYLQDFGIRDDFAYGDVRSPTMDTTPIIDPVRTKEYEEFQAKASERLAKYDELVEQLDDLGVYTGNLTLPNVKIPDEWFVDPVSVGVYKPIPGSITIYCESTSEVYKWFRDSGLLEKWYPKWYESGEW